MSAELKTCSACGAQVAGDVAVCPACATVFPPPSASPQETVAPEAPPAEPTLAPPSEPTPAPEPARDAPSPVTETMRRLARLKQWGEAARPLGVELPTMPVWAEEMARSGEESETWMGVLRGIERLAQKRVVHALETWEERTRGRLVRLAAYSVEGRMEREQMEDALHQARAGEVTQALTTFQQVDRVIALKERHIDQARDELERLVSLLRDMQALGFTPPDDAPAASEELERELRSGRLASLKQRLRSLRQEALNRLKTELPKFVAQYGETLVRERASGVSVDLEAGELARGSRDFSEGKVEESLRRLRLLSQVHGSAFPRSRSEPATAPPTELSRTG
ncbi:MAG: hypothetical protein WCA77_07895 [Thermoplasmata archaeon]